MAKARQRLGSLDWFMKCLKEPLSRTINKSEKCIGSLFRRTLHVDRHSYIDLNPVVAGIAPTPEQSDYTSIKSRVENVATQQQTDDLREVMNGFVALLAVISQFRVLVSWISNSPSFNWLLVEGRNQISRKLLL